MRAAPRSPSRRTRRHRLVLSPAQPSPSWVSIVKQYRAICWILEYLIHCSSTRRIAAGGGEVNRPERERASTSTDAAAGNRRASVTNPRVPRDSDPPRARAHAAAIPVSNQECRCSWRRTRPEIRVPGSGHQATPGQSGPTVAAGAETVWHRLQATDEIYFVLSRRGAGFPRWRGRARRCGLDKWPVPQKIRALGSVLVDILVRLRPGLLHRNAISAWASSP